MKVAPFVDAKPQPPLLVALIKYKEIKSFLFRKVDKNNQKNIEKMSNPVLNYWAPSQHLYSVL